MHTRDRLPELQAKARGAGAGADDAAADLPPNNSEKKYEKLEDVLLQAERAAGWQREMEEHTGGIRAILSDDSFHNNPAMQVRLETLGSLWQGVSQKLAAALRELDAAARGSDVVSRAARLQAVALRSSFAEALREHLALLQGVRDHRRGLLLRQAKLTNLSITEEECESLLESNNLSIFVENLEAETAEAQRALRDTEARHNELLRVERALRDVHELFHTLGSLVAAQQEQIDSVQYLALQASEHVDGGQAELLKGRVSKTGARKKKFGLIICLAAGFFIVLLILIAT